MIFFSFQIPKVTPIHEPTTEESPVIYGAQYVYQKPEYDSAYKVPISAKDYQASTAYLKYENPAKTLLPKHQAITNSNAYASLAPSYTYLNSDQPNSVPAPKKYTTYDPENNVQIQYVIKYVPVPYTVSTHDQYPQNTPDVAYITPRPYYYNSATKKTITQDVQGAHAAASHAAYTTSTEAYGEYAKYAESYAPLLDDSSPSLPSFKYIQPPTSPYKYYQDKSAKKYVPTSYVLASIGKTLPAHYSTSIKHESVQQDGAYPTKLVPIPLPVDKYTAQDFKASPVEDTKTYSDPDYAYAISNTKYKQSLIPAVSHLLSYDYGVPYQHRPAFYKKDVSNSVSSTSNYDSSSEKHK